jgi:hypothetical protein
MERALAYGPFAAAFEAVVRTGRAYSDCILRKVSIQYSWGSGLDRSLHPFPTRA